MNFATFLGTPFLIEQLLRLLLQIENYSNQSQHLGFWDQHILDKFKQSASDQEY